MNKLFLIPVLIFTFLFVGCSQSKLTPTKDYIYLDGYSYATADANSVGVFRVHPGNNPKRQFETDAHTPSFYGDKIVYVRGSMNDGRHLGDLFLANADGTKPVNLTDTINYDETDPSFSPDGSQIGYLQNQSFCLINVDGTQPWCFNNNDLSYQIIDPNYNEYHELLQYTLTNGYSWGPDGQIVISASYTDYKTLLTEETLFLVHLVDNHIDSVTYLGSGSDAQFSPDGRHIAYYNDDRIWLRDLTSGQISILVERPMTADTVVYSPDGSQIAFLEDDYLKVADNLGQNARAVAGPFTNWYPVDVTWSPDGTQIGFTDGRNEINPGDSYYHFVGNLTIVDLNSSHSNLVHKFTYTTDQGGIRITAWVNQH